jgi:hypothetical protein
MWASDEVATSRTRYCREGQADLRSRRCQHGQCNQVIIPTGDTRRYTATTVMPSVQEREKRLVRRPSEVGRDIWTTDVAAIEHD